MIWSIIYFLIVSIGLGFLIDLLIEKWSAGFLEKIIIRIGAGTLLIPVFGVVFNFLRIPIDWVVFLVLSVVMAASALHYRKKQIQDDFSEIFRTIQGMKIKKSHIYTFLALCLFLISLQMYMSGTFVYPWLEDGDPYNFVTSAKYISIEKTYSAPFYFDHFSEPYPQGFSIFLGILHQTNDSINWTAKFFTALIVSMSVLFFFYFVRKASGSYELAFWSSLILTAIPAWLGHFIFALNFNMSLMLVMFYALFSLKEDSRWKYVAGLLYGSIFINHFYTAFIISVMIIILYILKVLVYKEFFKDNVDAFVIGVCVGMTHWIYSLMKHWSVMVGDIRTAQIGGLDIFQPVIVKFLESPLLLVGLFAGIAVLIFLWLKNELWFVHVKKTLKKKNVDLWIYVVALALWILLLVLPSEKLISARGSGDRVYTFADFFIAQQGNMINNPLGIGMVAMLLFIIGLVLILTNYKKMFSEKNFFYLVAVTWAIFSFLGLHGTSLSIAFAPFRMWTFFGMSLSIIAGFGLYNLLGISNAVSKERINRIGIKVLLAVVIVFLLYLTSFSQKYWHNTALWPEHQILVPESRDLYIWMKDGGLPKDTMVLPLCNRPSVTIAYDMMAEPWKTPELMQVRYLSSDPVQFFVRSLNESLDENYAFLKQHGYAYTIIGADCVAKSELNQTLLNTRLQEMLNSSRYTLVKNTPAEFLFRVN